MSRKVVSPWLLTSVMMLAMVCSVPASATSNGISGFSGKSSSICTSCHSNGTAPSVTLNGPTSVSSGSTNSYTITVGSSGNHGIDLATSAGTLTAGAGGKISGGELVHSSPSSTGSWTFTWTAPTVTSNTAVTFWAAGVNGFGGGTGTLQQNITVTAPPAAPTMAVTPTSLAFAYTIGGANPAAKSLSVSSSGAAFNYTAAASGGSWLSATPASGATPGNVSVSVNPAALAAGTYNGSVLISSATASNGPISVPVTLTVTAPALPSMTVSPASMTFNYQIGGSAPGAQNASVSSSAGSFSYSATSSPTWLGVTPANGNAPGNLSVSVNPQGLAAGTYNGTITATSSGASNSPRTIMVTLNVTAAPPPPANPSLTASPGSLSFSYTMGGTVPAAKSLSISSSGSALNYTVGASTSWLIATGSGSTPGSVSISVNPASMTAGTYNGNVTITAAGAANSPQMVPVTLTVTPSTPPPPPPPTGTGSVTVSATRLVFYAQSSQDSMSPKSIAVGSTGSALSYTAAAYGGSWLSVNPSGGTTPGRISVSAYATGLPAGTYSCVLQIKAGNSTKNVAVVLVVSTGRSGGGGGGDDGEDSKASPFTFDPKAQNTVTAGWQSGAGALRSSGDTTNQGLVLNKKRSAPVDALAGVMVNGAAGSQLSDLSFDIRSDSECTATAPQFVIITDDNVSHIAGCATGTARRLTATGWKRVHFNPANSTQIKPAIQPGSTVKTVALVMDQIAGNGMAVLDNINLNGKYIGKQ